MHPSSRKDNTTTEFLTTMPKKRSDNIIVKQLDQETLIYDMTTHQATCLDQRGSAVWSLCDGSLAVTDIVSNLNSEGFGSDEISAIIEDLSTVGLLEGSQAVAEKAPELSRRSALFGIGAAAATVSTAVTTISAPTPAEAASGMVCENDLDCGLLLVCIKALGATVGVCGSA